MSVEFIQRLKKNSLKRLLHLREGNSVVLPSLRQCTVFGKGKQGIYSCASVTERFLCEVTLALRDNLH